MNNMQWGVYYLYSRDLNIYYIGKTNDLGRRLKEHLNSEEVFTRRARDWELVGFIACEDNVEAVRLESKLKKSKNKKYIKWFFEQYKLE